MARSADSAQTAAARRIRLEIAIESLDDAIAAHRGGADRLELSAALNVEGLTPPVGLITRIKRATTLPVTTMIRPRAGSFCCGPQELTAMAAAVAPAIEHGADGLVFGCLTEDDTIDIAACRRLVSTCDGRTAVFHRAFDLVLDQCRALEQLIDVGFTRVLTSGRRGGSVLDGCTNLRRLIEQAAGRIEVLPGGGIRPHNAAELIRATGCDHIHSSCRADAGAAGARDGGRCATIQSGTNGHLVAELRREVDWLR